MKKILLISKPAQNLFTRICQLTFLVLLLSGGNVFGQYTGTGTFTKITSLANLTDGYYVITNEADAFLMTNGRSGTAATGFFVSDAVTPSSSSITNPSTNNVWKIETNGSGRTIYNEVSTKYVGWSSGNAASIEDTPANSNRWTFTYTSSKFTVLNVATTSRQLSYNSGAPRFAAYANNGQQELQLYKLSGNTVTFNANGGTGTMANQTASSATNLTTNTFTRTGFTFAGWNTAANGSGTAYANNASFPFTANATLFAQWASNALTTLANNGTPVAAGNIIQGTNNTILATYTLAQTGAATVLNEARFTTSGTYAAADINGNGFRLWYNTTNTFGTATQLASLPSTAATSSGDLLEFTGLTQALALGSTSYFWVTANLSLSATVGNTLLVDAMIGNDFIVSVGTKAGNASVSGTKTIVATLVSTLTVTPASLIDFGNVCLNTDSTLQSYTLSGVNLSGNVTVNAPAGFKVRKGVEAYTTSTTLIPDGANEVNSTIDVVYSPTAIGGSGTLSITNTSSGAVTKNVSVSGTGSNGAVTINSVAATAVTTTTGTSGGTAVTTGCGTITAKGVVWGTAESPTIPSANSTNDGTGTATFTSSITGLTENTLYYVRAYATNSNGITVHGANIPLTTLSKAPSAALANTATTSGFTASWTAPTAQGAAALTYTVRIYSNNTFTSQVGSAITGISGTSSVVAGLSSGTTYYYSVAAVNAGGESALANFSGGITTLTAPLSCLNEDFSGGVKPTGWIDTTTGITYTSNYADISVGSGSITMSVISNPSSLKFDLSRTTNTTAKNLNIEVSTTSQVSGFSVVTFYNHANTTPGGTIPCTIDLSAYSSSGTVYIRFNKTSGNTSPWRIDNVEVFCAPACTPSPDSVGTISGTFTACATTTLTYSGADSATAYWQTTATGTNTAEPATSSKIISSSGTYFVRNFASSCWSTGTVSQIVTINDTPVITTQPINASVVAGSNTTFSVVATNVAGFQWQVNTGSGFINLTNAAPYANVTTATLNITNATFAMTGYLYRCVLTANAPCVNTTTNGLATLIVTNAAPNNVTALRACLANNQISLSWTASSGGTPPTGYIVFAQLNTTIPQMTAATAGNASGYTANANYSAATSYTTLGKAVYKGAGTTATITGLTNASQYTFKVVAYNGETGTGWATGINASGSWNQAYTIDVPEITSLAASINPTTSTVTWNVVPLSSGCYEYMVVANNGAVTLNPTGNGSTYTANTAYSSSNQVVYKGTENSVVVTGLTTGVNYCYEVFVREVNSGNQWSDGTSICRTTAVNYCVSQGLLGDATGITSVVFNTINQTSPSTNAYTDFTSVSTTVALGATHNLSVNVNTDTFRNYTRAWIDWNRDGDFSDSGESYDLGDAYDGLNELTSNSPLSITVPSNATIGNTRMRIATQYFDVVAPIAIPINLTPCGTYDFGEVEDYTITVSQPLNAEINVKGVTISIANGFDTPFGLNNTLFAATPLNTDSIEKEFTIENLGIANLTLTGSPLIQITGAHPTDFIVTQQATTPVVSSVSATFKIKFNPTVAGIRTANVRIESNDADENPYIFAIQGAGTCATEPTIAIFPLSGPANTIVTFISTTDDLTGATVTYNNATIPLTLNTATKIEVFVPINANDGNFIITLATGCNKTQAFDFIDTNLTACETSGGGGINATDLVIYEIYDENAGSGGVITLYNRTGSSVNLSTYSIDRAPDFNGTYANIANLSGSIAAGAVAVIGVTGSPCGFVTTGNGNFGSGFNANDGFRLMKGSVILEQVHAPNYAGYYLKRRNTNLNPNATFTDSEWITQSLAVSECLTTVAALPLFQIAPVIISQPVGASYGCGDNSISFSIVATEGVANGLPLDYQWYFNAPESPSWTEASGAGISGGTTSTLNINIPALYDGYQFYGQVRENTATCYTASQAVAVVGASGTITFSGGVWVGGTPTDITKNVVIATGQSYSTSAGAITARSLINNGTITVDSANAVVVEFNLINNGTFSILDGGSLVQNCEVDNAASNNNVGSVSMQRTTQPMYRLDYTYWSAPVSGNTLIALSPATQLNRFFEWNASAGSWGMLSGGTATMSPGKGYIVRAPNNFGIDPADPDSYDPFTGTFSGIPNNGTVTTPVSGAASGTNIWNLIGNPYPSAIDAEDFLNANTTVLGGTLYFWTHNSPFGATTYAYSAGDYASWNGSGGIATATDLTSNNFGSPTGKIAAGQGFFVQGIANGDAVFNNSMRIPGDNLQFFRPNPAGNLNNANTTGKHRVWLNLQGATQGFSQTLVGYISNATNGFDSRFDGISFGGNSVTFYSVLDTKNLVIQGRALPFVQTDEVPLGYKTTQTGNLIISIDHVDGLMQNQGIYLKDNVLNIVHDLKASPYTFTAVPGTFNDRFVLRYVPDAVLDNPTFNDQINSVIIRKNDATLRISSPYETINNVKVYDIAGRLVFEKKDCNSNTFETSSIVNSEQVLIVKVILNNGGVVTEKVF